MTLNGWYTLLKKRCILQSPPQIWMKTDPCNQQQKCRLITPVSGNIRYMRIFTEVPWEEGIKWQYAATGKLQICRFQRPHPLWRCSCKKRLQISTNNFYWEKLESLNYISATDSERLFWYFSHNYLWKSNAPSQEVLAKNGFWHEIAIQGDSRSFILSQTKGSIKGSILSYNTAGLISEVCEEVTTQIASPKIAVVDNPTLIWCPRQEEPPWISTCTLYFQKLESMAHGPYLYTDSAGLSSFKFVQRAPKTHLFCNTVHFGRSKSSKVDDFGINRMRMRLPICPPLWLCLILHHFRDMTTYWLTIAYFSYPSYSAPSLPMFSLKFRSEVNHQETSVMGLSSSEDPVIVAWVLLTQCQRVMDGRTEGRTDGFTVASTVFCIACYTDVL